MPAKTLKPPCSAARTVFLALQLTEEQASQKWGQEQVDELMALMAELVIRLPRCDLMAATVDSVNEAGRAMIADGRSKEQIQMLQVGVVAFFDAARQLKLTHLHPIRDRRPAFDGPMTSTLLISSHEEAVAAAKYANRGCNSVVRDDQVEDLKTVFSRIENAPPRVCIKIPIMVSKIGGGASAKMMWQTQDISASGILARTAAKIEIGTAFDCEMRLPGETVAVRFRAEVTRKTTSKRENISGLAARFVGFDPGVQERLTAFIAKQQKT